MVESTENQQQIIESAHDEKDDRNKGKPKGYMLMFNIAKAKNFGTIIRSAAAFNLSEIFLVESASKKTKLTKSFGSQGTNTKMATRYFASLQDVREYCTQSEIRICGIEITPEAEPIQNQPFKGDTLFLLGNEGSGLNENQMAICDHFVYIPQYSDKTASLNVAIAGSIIFHHFALWAQYQESSREGFKFDVGHYQQGSMPCIVQTQDQKQANFFEDHQSDAQQEDDDDEEAGNALALLNENQE